MDTSPNALIEHMHHNVYGYTPTEYVCIIFIVIFALSTSKLVFLLAAVNNDTDVGDDLVTHVGQAFYTKKYYLLATVALCGVSELIG